MSKDSVLKRVEISSLGSFIRLLKTVRLLLWIFDAAAHGQEKVLSDQLVLGGQTVCVVGPPTAGLSGDSSVLELCSPSRQLSIGPPARRLRCFRLWSSQPLGTRLDRLRLWSSQPLGTRPDRLRLADVGTLPVGLSSAVWLSRQLSPLDRWLCRSHRC